MEQKVSPALQLMKIMWHHEEANSWQRLNQSLYAALHAAIKAGLHFSKNDFETIAHDMNGGYWFGKDDGRCLGESFYNAAIEYGNNSAWKSFESWKNRKPYIVDGKRLHLRYRFVWDNRRVKVTSFNDDDGYVVACSYKQTDDVYHRESEVERVYKITRADIYARNKAIRDVEKAQQEPAT